MPFLRVLKPFEYREHVGPGPFDDTPILVLILPLTFRAYLRSIAL
jgi:hypothetical protein